MSDTLLDAFKIVNAICLAYFAWRGVRYLIRR